MPSGNGANETGRDAKGRFVKGNPGGPGNPFVRKVAAARKALLDAAGPEQIAAIAAALVERAIAGDVAAAKVVLRYVVGDTPGLLDALVRMRAAATWWSNPLSRAGAELLAGTVEPDPPAGPPADSRTLAAAGMQALVEGLRQDGLVADPARKC